MVTMDPAFTVAEFVYLLDAYSDGKDAVDEITGILEPFRFLITAANVGYGARENVGGLLLKLLWTQWWNRC